MEEIKTFIPIAKTAEITGLAETYLRKLRERECAAGSPVRTEVHG